MSDVIYRDDDQDNLFVSDAAIIVEILMFDDVSRLSDAANFGIGAAISDIAVLSDGTGSRPVTVFSDTASISDDMAGNVSGRAAITERLVCRERVFQPQTGLVSDSAAVSDVALADVSGNISDWARIYDEAFGTLSCTIAANDRLAVSDDAGLLFAVWLDDYAALSDTPMQAAGAAGFAVETMTAQDGFPCRLSAVCRLSDNARCYDAAASSLTASASAEDVLEADDNWAWKAEGDDIPATLAWSANTDSWAVSRYLLQGWRDIAVIDGTLFGFADDGVYALSDNAAETIRADVLTGRLDVGGGVLVHPLAAFLEYSLNGNAAMSVSSTQSGFPQSFTYRLAAEPADFMTNGRFVFGRGLRGRYFAFSLTLSGRAGFVKHWRGDAVPTKRRI